MSSIKISSSVVLTKDVCDRKGPRQACLTRSVRVHLETGETVVGNPQRPEVHWTYGSAKDYEDWMAGIVPQILP